MDMLKYTKISLKTSKVLFAFKADPWIRFKFRKEITILFNLFTISALCVSCKVHTFKKSITPDLEIPENFALAPNRIATKSEFWWKSFGSSELNNLMVLALEQNFDLKTSWNRLAQARATYVVNRAGQFPFLNLNNTASITKATDKRPLDASQQFIDIAESLGVPVIDGDLTTENIIIGSGLSYELDVWRRVKSLKESARFNLAASIEDVQATALLVSASVVDAWLSVRQQVELLKLLREQLNSNETQLELLELRLSVGQATSLDVLQQRQQVAATEAAIPAMASILDTEQNRLQILIGQIPIKGFVSTNEVALPEFTKLQGVSTPLDLLNSRPDLRAAKKRINAADQDVAAAVANRLPRLSLNLTYDFQATELAGPFHREMTSVIGNLTGPIFEGGRRKAEVNRRKAILEEQLNQYTQLFLNSLLEVENALIQEKRQNESIYYLEEQIKHVQQSLEESRARYINGLNDYLPVLTSLQTKQLLERNLILERRRRLAFRCNLLRALGGEWSKSLAVPNSQEAK